jgi:uncharacterized protein (TIGR02391 family)
MSTDLTWIKDLSHSNLVTVYGVLLDIKDQAEFDSEEIVIRLLPANDHLQRLIPGGPIRSAEEVAEKRQQAIEFLQKKGLIKNLSFDPGMFVSETDVCLIPVSPQSLDEALAAVRATVEMKIQHTSSKSSANKTDFWSEIHPKIAELARPRFEADHLADAVEASFKEVNDRVKSIVRTRTGQDNDGAPLMKQAFSPNNPIISLADMSSKSGQSEQQGYMEIFAGAMTGIRNPKAHSNIVIDEKRAIHLLYLASLLMYKLEDAKLALHQGTMQMIMREFPGSFFTLHLTTNGF